MNKPTADDVKQAIVSAEGGHWNDPAVTPIYWGCILYKDGKRAGDGCGRTAGEAMAFAWLCHWAPDALTNAYVEPDSVPLEISDGYRFELYPPAAVDDNGAAVDNRPYLPAFARFEELRGILRQAIKDNPNATSLGELMVQAYQDAPAGLTISEVVDELNKTPPAAALPKINGPDPRGVVDVVLRDYRLPLTWQQYFIQDGLAAEVAELLAKEAKLH